MTTKEQERAAVEKIRKIIEELGENSYVGFAMEGVLELAEENIREDTAYSMKKRAELIEERAREAEKENKLLKAELGTAKKITMADASIAGEDVQRFAAEYKTQKEKRNRYARMMDTLDERERRMQGRK